MVLSKQERILVIVTVLVLGIWAANAVVVEPLSDLRRQTANEKLELQGQLEQARNTFNRRKALERKWKGLLSEGMQSDADAEIRIARALTEWSKQTGMSLSSLTPERTTTDKGMKEVTFVVAGQGDLEGVASFLYRVETAEPPVKVTHMQLGSSSESGDSMYLQLRLSAIYAGASQKAAEKTSKKQTESSDVMTVVAAVLALGPATGSGQESPNEPSSAKTVVVDPNATGQQSSWASFSIILQRNIFSRQRMPAQRRTEESSAKPAVVTRNPEAYFVLRGVVQEDDDLIAFIENSQTGTVLKLRRGDPVARGTIRTLTLDGLEYQIEDKTPTVVRMGSDLEGGIGVLTTTQMLDLASMPAPAASSPPAESGADMADILKRLMEQRKQQLGQ